VAASVGQSFTATLADFTDADPAGAASDYTVAIVWGDGKSSKGTITLDGNGGFYVSGTHTYTTSGTFTLKITIADAGGSKLLLSPTATVS
jgi:hypothetical protein